MPENGVKEELIRQIADIRQSIGKLDGKVDGLSNDVKEIKQKVDNLNVFRWKTVGAVTAVGFLAGILGGIIAMLSYFHAGG